MLRGFDFGFQLISGAAVLYHLASVAFPSWAFSLNFPDCSVLSDKHKGSPRPLRFPQPSPAFFSLLLAKSELSPRAGGGVEGGFRNPRSRTIEMLFSRPETCRD